MTGLGEILRRSLEAIGGTEAYWEGVIRGRWERLVGAAVAEHVAVGRLRSGRLEILAESGPWAQEAAFWREELRGKIRRELGLEIAEVRVRAGPSRRRRPAGRPPAWPEPPPPEGIADDRLAEAFYRWRRFESRRETERRWLGGRECRLCGAVFLGEGDRCPVCRLETS